MWYVLYSVVLIILYRTENDLLCSYEVPENLEQIKHRQDTIFIATKSYVTIENGNLRYVIVQGVSR